MSDKENTSEILTPFSAVVNNRHEKYLFDKELRHLGLDRSVSTLKGSNVNFKSTSTHSSSRSVKKVYKANLKKKKPNPSKAISLAIAAAIAVGSLVAFKFHSDIERQNFEKNQEILVDISDNPSVLNELSLSQDNSNALQLLNADFKKLSEKYTEDPSSVSEQEVKDLLDNCSSLGRHIVFDKVDSGLRDYYKEHPDKSPVQSADELDSSYIYRIGSAKDNESAYFIAIRGRTPNNSLMDTCVADGQKISEYVGIQLDVKNYIDSDDFKVDKGLDIAQKSIGNISRMALSEISFHDDFLGSKITDVNYLGSELELDDSEKSTEKDASSHVSETQEKTQEDDSPEL